MVVRVVAAKTQRSRPSAIQPLADPREVGGDAIADVLDGSYNPTAKLPYTIYPAAFNLTRPITDMSLRGGEGITHLHYTGKPLWKFGTGERFICCSVVPIATATEVR